MTIGTDSAPNMIAAASLPFEHVPCVVHIVQRIITVLCRDSRFDGVLDKCNKIVGHFKHSPANSAGCWWTEGRVTGPGYTNVLEFNF